MFFCAKTLPNMKLRRTYEMLCVVNLQGRSEPLRNWEVSFWGEKLQESKYNLTDEQLRPYFSLPNVLDGLHSVRTCLIFLIA